MSKKPTFDFNKSNQDNLDTNAEKTAQEAQQGLEFPSRSDLENQLTAMEMKVDEYKNMTLRAQAELENIRRRAEKDVINAQKFGIERLTNDLLPVMDSLIQSLAGPELKDPHLKAMREGMGLTLSLLEKALEKHGVKVIAPAKGDPFNPQTHQAMSALSDPNVKPNTIVEVLQKGYQLNERVLRPAMVIVAQ